MSYRVSAAAVSGVATAVLGAPSTGGGVQVTLHDITTGTGTVTLTVMPTGTDEYQPVTDGTIDLSDSDAPKTVTIAGAIAAIKATSSSSSDAFTLLVGGV